jgi:hypothetical protein
MARQNTAIFGIYCDDEGVERAVGILQTVGVRNTDISLLFPEKKATKNFVLQTASLSSKGMAAGTGRSAISGGVLGWLVGVGVLTIPDLVPFLVAGPIVAALADVGPSGRPGLASSLLSLGLSENEANGYEDQILRGGILMSVHCDRPDCAQRAKQILQDTGAEYITSSGEANAGFIDENDKPSLRHVARRSKRLNSMWKTRSLTALWAIRKRRGLGKGDRLWKRARVAGDAIRRSNRNTMLPDDRQAKNLVEKGPLLLPA